MVKFVEILFICLWFPIWEYGELGTSLHAHTHAAWAPLQFARNYLNCVIYTRLPPVKGWTCSFNLSLFYRIYLLPVNSVPVFITAICFLHPLPFSVYTSTSSLRTPLLCSGCRSTQFNFTVLLQHEGGLSRCEGERKGKKYKEESCR